MNQSVLKPIVIFIVKHFNFKAVETFTVLFEETLNKFQLQNTK
jgi:hypothetical protein